MQRHPASFDPPEDPDDLPVPDYLPDLSVPTREPRLAEEDQ